MYIELLREQIMKKTQYLCKEIYAVHNGWDQKGTNLQNEWTIPTMEKQLYIVIICTTWPRNGHNKRQ